MTMSRHSTRGNDMTITVELSEDQAKAFLHFLHEAPRQNAIVEDASSRVRVAIGKALGLHG
jgi:hypothetical protein